MSADDSLHGTYKGTQRHKRAGESPCADCALAFAIYQRQRRRRLDLGLPVKGHDPRPIRADVADMAAVGPVLHAGWVMGA